nr:MAG TPA: hypothetical protein [Caudoviricetes sp.]
MIIKSYFLTTRFTSIRSFSGFFSGSISHIFHLL